MKILVLNSGSSSIKYKVFESDTMDEIASGIKEEVTDHSEGIKTILKKLQTEKIIDDPEDILCVGHRVVHGGDYFDTPVVIDTEVCNKIEELCELAPLHNPANLEGIKAVQQVLPSTKQIAVFDTAFHQSIPNHASIYPLPFEYYEKYQIKKYGFHGTSHQYVAKEAAKKLDKSLDACNLITLHLGNGASACAVKKGKSVDTSMGFTPLEGLMMGTRCGDIDPSLVFYLEEKLNYSTDEINTLLNKKSGFKGFCGTNDLREVIAKSQIGDKNAKLAIDIFIYRIKKYIGSYLFILENVDAVVLTGGIGEHSTLIQNALFDAAEKFNLKQLIIPTNEELSIAIQAKELIS
jgi:acetate kinase